MIGGGLSKRTEQLEKELQTLKDEISQLAGRKEQNAVTAESAAVPPLIKQMIEERARTNKMLEEITSKIQRLEKEMAEDYEPEQEYEIMNREVPLSALDSRVLDFVQSRGGMVCADDLVSFMGYKGRNAACTRLNRLYRQGVLDRYQLGHKVFYKFDAGKATNTLIISPPQ